CARRVIPYYLDYW
nr:immunoglobulin heavy chain junction region [Macaca mulatta]